MYIRSPFGIAAVTLLSLCTIEAHHASAQGCTELSGVSYSQGDLYAVFERGLGRSRGNVGPQPQRLYAGIFASNELIFAPNLRLIYVLDNPNYPTSLPGVRRDFSGVIAARLVASPTAAGQRAPSVVRLYRDAVRTSRNGREPLSRSDFPALTYYVYHNPRLLRASDSFLDREFHTSYVSSDGQPDRQTNDPQERRAQFHFPEMKEAPRPDNMVSKVASMFNLGTPALAATPETGFEAQIRYYSKSITPRCVKIDTQLPSADDRSLKITLTDLDFPGGVGAFGSTETWTITWKQPSQKNK